MPPAERPNPPQAILATPGLPALLHALPQARLVGGSVRDALAGLPVADIDLATPDPPDQIMQALAQAGIRAIPTGLAHGTVTALVEGRPFEITTLRRDLATDGRHAQVAWTNDWQEDAARRDFTINAMSMDRDGTLHDYFGGRDDLAAGRVRFVGEPASRVAEDYLRILRFFRFFARYAKGRPDEAALAAIRAGITGLAQLSAERVWSELKRILAIPHPTASLRLMADIGVLAEVLPEANSVQIIAELVAAGLPPDPLLRLAALLRPETPVPPLAERLRLSGSEAATLAGLRQGPVPHPSDTDAALRRLLADALPETLHSRTWLVGGTGPQWDALRHRLAAIPPPRFPLEGRDALALGAQPGPHVGEALRQVRTWWLEDGCTAPPEILRERLRSALAAS